MLPIPSTPLSNIIALPYTFLGIPNKVTALNILYTPISIIEPLDISGLKAFNIIPSL